MKTYRIAIYFAYIVVAGIAIYTGFVNIQLEEELSHARKVSESKDKQLITIYGELKEFQESESPTVITAGHLPKEDMYEKGYIVIEDIPQTDRTIYYKKKDSYMKIPVGKEVNLNGRIKGKVIDSEEGMFEVKVNDPTKIYKGLSGTPVSYLLSGLEIGYVSSMTENSTVICYTYR